MKTRLMSVLLTALVLSGCATFGDNFANRLSCTIAKDTCFVNSMYGPIGVTSELDKRDSAVLNK